MTLQSDIRDAVAGTITNHFHARLQEVYAGIQRELGIAGDISPMECMALESAETTLSLIVGNWLCNSLNFDQAEALGMDGTGRFG